MKSVYFYINWVDRRVITSKPQFACSLQIVLLLSIKVPDVLSCFLQVLHIIFFILKCLLAVTALVTTVMLIIRKA